MMQKPNGALLFMMLLVTAASFFAAEAYSQPVSPAGRGGKAAHSWNLSVGGGMDYWSGDWGKADINRGGATAWASTTIWHCLGINAEGHSMILGGNEKASNYKLFVGEAGLICTVGAWDRIQPLYKAELGFASLTQPGNGTGHLHSTYGTWSVGGGVEFQMREHWWTRVEYTYDAITNFHSSISNQNHNLDPRGIAIGLTYRFGAPKDRFPEPVVVADQDTRNLPGPYTANRRSETNPNPAPPPETATVTPAPQANVPAPAPAPETPAPQANVPAPAPAPETPAPQANVPAPAPGPETPAPQANVPAPAPAPETPPPDANVPAPGRAPGTPPPQFDVPAPAPVPRTPAPKAKVPAPATGPGTPVPNGKAPGEATATGTPSGKIPAITTSRFVLGPNDVIHVDVWKNTELSQTVIVAPDGSISLPLVNSVHVAGMTTTEAAQALRSKLTDYIVNPHVTVSVVTVHSRQVFVLGQVTKPGSYPLLGQLNVLQAIALAGGLTPYAKHEGIMILRESKGGTEKIRFNYNSAVHGDATQNVFLLPGDIVVVP
jgi:polysaccharide biosynthesis/export protein